MAYDSVRAQLDKLLGTDRNGPLTAASTTPTDYHHPEICKNYLLGFCPEDLYIKHRSEPGSCRRRHSDSAKKVFEKDVASSKAGREKARWIAALLSECRAILMDEDRKIRSHARRLKETYNAQGELAGLMIQNFDTLKKLGMVSKDAKIRILSEMDDDELVPEPTTTSAADREEDTGSQKPKNLSNSKNPALQEDSTLRTQENGDKNKVATDAVNPSLKADNGSDSDSNSGNGNSTDDADADDDDDDDFGLIKVIPAEAGALGEGVKQDGSLKSGSLHLTAKENGSSKSAASKRPDDLKENGAATPTATTAVEAHDKHESTKNPPSATKEAEITERTEIKAEATTAGIREKSKTLESDENSGKKESPSTDKGTEPEALVNSPPKEEQQTANSPKAVKDEGNEEEEITAPPSMDEFYERGVGPDGLLMLDRKQSLRVCACCGGYISLVDAESRLLSHYGGKTHHSLAQLRKKVVELETEAAANPVSAYGPPRVHARSYEEREHMWPHRGSERRHSGEYNGRPPERYHDRYGPRYGGGDRYEDGRRSRRDGRGYGTSDWYNNHTQDNDGRSSRRRYGRPDFGSGRSSRHSSGRKRYKSRSPTRDSRRPRHHY